MPASHRTSLHPGRPSYPRGGTSQGRVPRRAGQATRAPHRCPRPRAGGARRRGADRQGRVPAGRADRHRQPPGLDGAGGARRRSSPGRRRRRRERGFRTYVPPDTASARPRSRATSPRSTSTRAFVRGTTRPALRARVTQVVLTTTSVPGVKTVRLRIRGGVAARPLPRHRRDAAAHARGASPRRTSPPPEAGAGAEEPANDSTRSVQQQLADARLPPARAVDGEPGPATQVAVIAFQKWEGLERDGIVGPQTKAALAKRRATDAAHAAAAPAGASRCCSTASSRWRSRTTASSAPSRLHRRGRRRRRRPAASASTASTRAGGPCRSSEWLLVGARLRRRHRLPPVPRRAASTPASHGCVRVPATTPSGSTTSTRSATPVKVLDELAMRRARPRAAAGRRWRSPPRPRRRPTPPPTLVPDMLTVGLSCRRRASRSARSWARRSCYARGLEIDLARAPRAQLGLPEDRASTRSRASTGIFAPGAKPWDIALAQVTITKARRAERRLHGAVPAGRPGRAAAPGPPARCRARSPTSSSCGSARRSTRPRST